MRCFHTLQTPLQTMCGIRWAFVVLSFAIPSNVCLETGAVLVRTGLLHLLFASVVQRQQSILKLAVAPGGISMEQLQGHYACSALQ